MPMTPMTAGADPPAPLDDRVSELEQQISERVNARQPPDDGAGDANLDARRQEAAPVHHGVGGGPARRRDQLADAGGRDSGELVIEVATGASGPKAVRQR